MKILVVDDNDEIKKFLSTYLHSKNYEVYEASNGEEACELLEQNSFDLIFMDIQMPGMNGIETIRLIRERQIPVIIIALTDFNEVKIEEIAEAGFDDFVEKPINSKEIDLKLKLIKKYFQFYKSKYKYYSKYAKSLTELTKKIKDYEKTKDNLIIEAIQLLYNISEYRDYETHDHTMRIGWLSGKLAQEIGLSHSFVSEIQFAAPLHDIGKVGIPDAILLKSDKLTVDEWEIMKQHTIIGYKMLERAKNPILKLAAEIALTHHERWNGKGYPRGLKENEIPISGQIVAIADSFDAIVSKRPYKDKRPYIEGFYEIEKNAGILYNPVLVEKFLKLKNEIMEYYKKNYGCEKNFLLDHFK
ncbi:MAG: response regulator [Thermosipho sp. (in: Bacteria)]|nr:response regulator [Thermosipho sp. (in: thermotogales)]